MFINVPFFIYLCKSLSKQNKTTTLNLNNQFMKKHFYEAPELEQIELAVEAGFATSFEGDQTPSYDEEDIWGAN